MSGSGLSNANNGWNVILLIDHREYNEQNKRMLENELKQAGISFKNSKGLPAGDFMWIAKKGNQEYVLDTLIERKTPTDLVRSIEHECIGKHKPLTRVKLQMKKMKSSGIANLIYLLEGRNHYTVGSPDYRRVNTYMDRDVPSYGVTPRRTAGVHETIRFLIQTHHTLEASVRRNPPRASATTFDSFKRRIDDALNDPTFLWNLELQACIRGVGQVKADLISAAYPTKASLQAAFRDRGRAEMLTILSQMRGPGGRGMGGNAATNVLQRYCPRDVPLQRAAARDTPSPVARMPVRVDISGVATITPESMFANRAIADAHNSQEPRKRRRTLKDDAAYDDHGGSRKSRGHQYHTGSIYQPQLDDTTTCSLGSCVHDTKLPALTDLDRATIMLNKVTQESYDDKQPSRDIVDVDTGTVDQMAAPADSNAARRYEWLNSPDNVGMAHDFIEGEIQQNQSVTVKEIKRKLDELLDNLEVGHPTNE